ncbi:MAG TPA: hypothetical protein VMG34_14440 [Bacteroidota bacterium]|nr:hypothetical protein [Bacteroidota bacterium]
MLRHIGIEERLLLPATQRLRGGVPLPLAPKIRLDHGALVALMVPPPTPAILRTIRTILAIHNKAEEEVEGLYESAEGLIGPESAELFERMKGAGDVPTLPHNPDPKAFEAARRAVERAGYLME